MQALSALAMADDKKHLHKEQYTQEMFAIRALQMLETLEDASKHMTAIEKIIKDIDRLVPKEYAQYAFTL